MAEYKYTPCEIELSNTEAANLLISLYSDYEQKKWEECSLFKCSYNSYSSIKFCKF